jgi:hypothetical protein
MLLVVTPGMEERDVVKLQQVGLHRDNSYPGEATLH